MTTPVSNNDSSAKNEAFLSIGNKPTKAEIIEEINNEQDLMQEAIAQEQKNVQDQKVLSDNVSPTGLASAAGRRHISNADKML